MGSYFKFDTSRNRSELMKKIRSVNTKPEKILKKKLWNLGYRYRINCVCLSGKPDIVLRKYKLVIFIDGEFWHGYDWDKKKLRIKSNTEYWIPKIEGNMRRDELNNIQLMAIGYTVLRFWEKEITNDLISCVQEIQTTIKQ